ncbi:hypothetical protein FRC0263_01958 [Corynebacterium diphtheriae]|nr:hypothetical protein FRC0263_01958 [Corynebacterium diphtheriae]
MALEDIARHQTSLNQETARLVLNAIKDQGVPVTIDQVNALVDRLYPRVVKARRAAYLAQVMELGRQARAVGIEIRPEPLEDYPRRALFSAIADIARLSPRSTKIRLDLLDKTTGEIIETPVVPDRTNRTDLVVVNRIGRELGARIARHVQQAGRKVLSESAHNGTARLAISGRPVGAGYARVLSGRENCAFCTMLASRGAVYNEDTAIRRKDGRRYHDGCDCIPVLVVKGKNWEGQQQADALYERWVDITWDRGKPAVDQWGLWRHHVESDRFDATKFSPLSKK